MAITTIEEKTAMADQLIKPESVSSSKSESEQSLIDF